jgi:hypothetical protein
VIVDESLNAESVPISNPFIDLGFLFFFRCLAYLLSA